MCATFSAVFSPVRYTYGQPVPGTAEVELCRPLERHYYVPVLITPDNPEGVPEFIAPCHKETVQVCVPVPCQLYRCVYLYHVSCTGVYTCTRVAVQANVPE